MVSSQTSKGITIGRVAKAGSTTIETKGKAKTCGICTFDRREGLKWKEQFEESDKDNDTLAEHLLKLEKENAQLKKERAFLHKVLAEMRDISKSTVLAEPAERAIISQDYLELTLSRVMSEMKDRGLAETGRAVDRNPPVPSFWKGAISNSGTPKRRREVTLEKEAAVEHDSEQEKEEVTPEKE